MPYDGDNGRRPDRLIVEEQLKELAAIGIFKSTIQLIVDGLTRQAKIVPIIKNDRVLSRLVHAALVDAMYNILPDLISPSCFVAEVDVADYIQGADSSQYFGNQILFPIELGILTIEQIVDNWSLIVHANDVATIGTTYNTFYPDKKSPNPYYAESANKLRLQLPNGVHVTDRGFVSMVIPCYPFAWIRTEGPKTEASSNYKIPCKWNKYDVIFSRIKYESRMQPGPAVRLSNIIGNVPTKLKQPIKQQKQPTKKTCAADRPESGHTSDILSSESQMTQ